MKTVVLGAGVVGVMTAYFLARLGHEVSVIERRSGAALETSYANGCIIHASETMPWARPGMPMKILKWIGREDAPLLLRTSAIPHMWRWGLAFTRNCTKARYRSNTLANLRLALHSIEAFAEVRGEADPAYDHGNGTLMIFNDPAAFEAMVRMFDFLSGSGLAYETLDSAGCVRAEPALEATAGDLAGGVRFAGDEVGDCHKFTLGVTERCRALGVSFHFDTAIAGLEVRGGRVAAVATDHGPIEAERFVVSLGSHSAGLMGRAGIRVPIYPVKGVSITVSAEAWDGAVSMPILHDSGMFGLVPLGGRLRAAGSAEIGGYDATPDRARCQAIIDNVISVFPDFARCYDPATAEFWAGLRPVTPGGTPFLGTTPIGNLFINAGHGHLGWTLSCGSGKVVANIVDGRPPGIDMDRLTLDRAW